MTFASGEVIATPNEEKPFLAYISVGEHRLFSYPVDTVQEGEDAIIRGLRFLQKKAREDGYIPEG